MWTKYSLFLLRPSSHLLLPSLDYLPRCLPAYPGSLAMLVAWPPVTATAQVSPRAHLPPESEASQGLGPGRQSFLSYSQVCLQASAAAPIMITDRSRHERTWPRKQDAQPPATALGLVKPGGCTQEEQGRGTGGWREAMRGLGLIICFGFKQFRIMATEMNTSVSLKRQ